MSTQSFSAKDIKREWRLMDATGKVLGRLATEVATELMGKTKASFVPYLDNGNYVVIINASKIKVTGKKAQQKTYHRHSGYPGGMKVETYEDLLIRHPERIIINAVKGMLPKTKLGKEMIKKLRVFADDKHPFAKQLGLKADKSSEGEQPAEASAVTS